MQVVAKFEPNLLVERKLNELPQDVLYTIARETLDMSIHTIPMSVGLPTSGSLRRTSSARGVFSVGDGYAIGSFTDYASRVWNYNDLNTNWTTPGTHSQWYARTIKQYGKTILDTATNRAWKENM